MTNVKGYLISTADRSLFVRTLEDAQWAIEDSNYTVEALAPVQQAVNTDDSQKKFDDYVSVSSELYDLQQEHINHLQRKLEEFVDLVEAVVDIAIPTENLIECKAKLMLVHDACEKLLKEES